MRQACRTKGSVGAILSGLFRATEWGQDNGKPLSTSAAAMLCLPPPCCAPHIGKAVQGRVQVCKWGDNVVNATMRGDGWRTRHDGMKLLLRDLHVRAGVPLVCEVFNLFSDCIPQEGLNRMERGDADRL